MPNISKEKPDKISPPGTADFPSWWNSSVSQFPQSFSNSGQSLNMNSPPEPLHNVKQIDFQLPFHESSSTRPMGDSHPELTTTHGAGYTRPYEKQVEDQTKSVLSLGTSNFIFPTSQVGYSNSLVHIPYACSDPYYGGLFAPSGAHSLVHPQMVTMAPVRVPLPHDLSEHEPIYVNAKQYNAILRRRQTRAKLEAQNKLVKDRKPYLHESRHRHAMKRVRGSGGRFLSKNELQQNHSSSPVSGCRDTSKLGLPLLCINHLESKVIELDTSNVGACSTSCSDVSSISNGDDIPPTQPDPRFSSYSPGGGIMYNGSQEYPPNIR